MVQILDRLAGCALPEIVETGDQNQAAARRIQSKADIAKIRMRDVLQLGQRAGRPNAYHGPSGVEPPKEFFDFGNSSWLLERDVNGGKNSARERQQVCREDHLRLAQAGMFKDFRRVAMRENAVSLKILVYFHKVQIAPGIFAGSAGPRFAVANDRGVRRDPAGVRERPQRRFAPTAELGKAFGQAFRAVCIPNIKNRGLQRGVAQQDARQFQAAVACDAYNRDLSRVPHLTRASSFLWRDSRVFLLGVMIRMVSSPAMVPAISVNLAASTAAARGCAPLGGVFSTRRFSAGRKSSRNSASARASEGKGVGSSGKTEACLYPSWVFTRCSSCKSRESVAWVTRIFCAAKRRRKSS